MVQKWMSAELRAVAAAGSEKVCSPFAWSLFRRFKEIGATLESLATASSTDKMLDSWRTRYPRVFYDGDVQPWLDYRGEGVPLNEKKWWIFDGMLYVLFHSSSHLTLFQALLRR